MNISDKSFCGLSKRTGAAALSALLLLLLLSAAVSCGPISSGGPPHTDSTDAVPTEGTEAPSEPDYTLKTDLTLVSGGVPGCRVVCPSGAREAEKAAARDLAAAIFSLTGTELPVTNVSGGPSDEEIIVGMGAFSPAAAEYEKLTYGQYMLLRFGPKLLLGAWDDESLTAAVNMLSRLAARCKDESGNVTVKASLLSNETRKKTASFIPAFPGKQPLYVQNTGGRTLTDDSAQAAFRVSEEEYLSYLSRLSDLSYSRAAANDIGKNRFFSYTDAAGRLLLSVSWYPGQRLMRVVSEPRPETLLFGDGIAAAPRGDAPVTLMQVYQDNKEYKEEHPGGYVLRLSDGRYVIYDTGYAETARQMVEYMRSDNLYTDGKLHIAMILISHPHPDHMGGLTEMADKYADELCVETVAYNLVSNSRQSDLSASTLDQRHKSINAAAQKLGARVWCLRAGQKFDLAGTVLEVLFTPDELGELFLSGKNAKGEDDTTYDMNNSSVIVRVAEAGQLITFTGDCRGGESGLFDSLYSGSFASDIITVAHHGFNVVGSLTFYNMARPAVLLWPVRSDEADVSRSFVKQLQAASYVKRHFYEDELTVLTLPYTP